MQLDERVKIIEYDDMHVRELGLEPATAGFIKPVSYKKTLRKTTKGKSSPNGNYSRCKTDGIQQ
jgi:hypothetical protein